MTRIDETEEFSRDWDWFAVDQAGNVGHFTTAGLRPLPETVREDREGAETLIRYFEEVEPSTTWELREAAERDANGWGSAGIERFLRSFAEMSRRGLFSFNTQMIHGPEAAYYLVTRPKQPVAVESLPEEVRAILIRTRAPLRFDQTDYIRENETVQWGAGRSD